MKILYWLPRVLAIVFIGFLALFALDIFVPGQPISYYVVGLFMHLIPNFILAILLLIAWKHERVGGTLFIVIAAAFIFFIGIHEDLMTFLLIPLPVFLIGALFMYHGYLARSHR